MTVTRSAAAREQLLKRLTELTGKKVTLIRYYPDRSAGTYAERCTIEGAPRRNGWRTESGAYLPNKPVKQHAHPEHAVKIRYQRQKQFRFVNLHDIEDVEEGW